MKKRIALALLGALLVMASVPTVAYAQEESTENTNTLTPDKKPATTITKQINEDVYQVLDFDDTQEEDFAKKGFIPRRILCRLQMMMEMLSGTWIIMIL